MNGFQKLTDFLDSVGETYGVPGCDCIITKDGECVYRHSAGVRDLATGEPVTPQDTYWLYSASKLATCTAAVQLIEQGKLSLEDPVSKFLPEFADLTVREADGTVRPAKEVLTVRHLMTMTGGLDYDRTRPALLEALKLPAEQQTTRRIVAGLAADPLLFDPGTHFKYSYCHDVLGAVIEAASGQRLALYARDHIFVPLGMKDTSYIPTPELRSRMATQYTHTDSLGTLGPWNQENEWRFSDRYDSGGAGVISTVDDYIKFVTALSLGGTALDGTRILTKESIALMAKPCLDPVQLADFEKRAEAMRGYSYGLGVRTLINNQGICSPLGEFGWDGAAGAYLLVDPANRIGLFYAQHVYSCPIVYQQLHPRLRDVAGACLEETFGLDYHKAINKPQQGA